MDGRKIGFALLAGLAALAPASAATLSGHVSQSTDGAPVAGRTVSATRTIALDSGSGSGPDNPIPVEWNATTDANGSYSITVSDALSNLDRVLVYTRSTLHYNELHGGVETAAHTPRNADVAKPGVVTVDLRSNVSGGVDFSLDSNRSDYLVLMRDGVTYLATTVWRPARSGSWPAILARTTYDKEALQPDYPNALIPYDYAVVGQDVRGRHASEGIWKPFRDDGWGENQDGYDTIEWVAAQDWCDSHVGTYGGSALGIVQ